MSKPRIIDLEDAPPIPILYEDRAVLAVDKPAGWLVAPEDWAQTRRNLPRLLSASIQAGEWWAASRNLRFLRFVHRLDAETSGVLLGVKSPGAAPPISRLFEERGMRKRYLVVVGGRPPAASWSREDWIDDEPGRPGRYRVVNSGGRDACTRFKVLAERDGLTLLEAEPITGRTHQIRLHAMASGCPVAGDALYGFAHDAGLGLRAVELGYMDPFSRRPVCIHAPAGPFLKAYGFPAAAAGPNRAERGPAPAGGGGKPHGPGKPGKSGPGPKAGAPKPPKAATREAADQDAKTSPDPEAPVSPDGDGTGRRP